MQVGGEFNVLRWSGWFKREANVCHEGKFVAAIFSICNNLKTRPNVPLYNASLSPCHTHPVILTPYTTPPQLLLYNRFWFQSGGTHFPTHNKLFSGYQNTDEIKSLKADMHRKCYEEWAWWVQLGWGRGACWGACSVKAKLKMMHVHVHPNVITCTSTNTKTATCVDPTKVQKLYKYTRIYGEVKLIHLVKAKIPPPPPKCDKKYHHCVHTT